MNCAAVCRTLVTSRAASEDRVVPEVREALVVAASVPAEVREEGGSQDPAL